MLAFTNSFLIVDPSLARNCTTISPCQQDATLIRDAEIISNVVNECGRTELSGNIDVGENTENALAAGAVTQVKAGTVMAITIHQVNADGAGPYVCDMDPTGTLPPQTLQIAEFSYSYSLGNSLGATGQINLTVTNNVPGANGFSQAKTADFVMNVAMPADLACTGGLFLKTSFQVKTNVDQVPRETFVLFVAVTMLWLALLEVYVHPKMEINTSEKLTLII